MLLSVPNRAWTLSLKSTPVAPPTELIPVRFDPSIAGNAPVSLDAVKLEIRASATVPVRFPAGIEVKLAALAAGSVAGNRASGIVPDVKLAALKLVKSIVSNEGSAPLLALKNFPLLLLSPCNNLSKVTD